MQERLAELRERIERLHTEEAALARLYAQGKLNSNYDVLHAEWQSKVFETHCEITQLESGVEEVVDDLDQALCLLACIPQLITRMDRLAYLTSLRPAPAKRNGMGRNKRVRVSSCLRYLSRKRLPKWWSFLLL